MSTLRELAERIGKRRALPVALDRRVMRRDNYGERNMATRYPQYTIGQWIDTSEEAMNKPQATILYGVQIKPEKGAKWMHCCRGSEPLIYDTPEKASAAIAELKAADAAAA